jgi:hypothetical protein
MPVLIPSNHNHQNLLRLMGIGLNLIKFNLKRGLNLPRYYMLLADKGYITMALYHFNFLNQKAGADAVWESGQFIKSITNG